MKSYLEDFFSKVYNRISTKKEKKKGKKKKERKKEQTTTKSTKKTTTPFISSVNPKILTSKTKSYNVNGQRRDCAKVFAGEHEAAYLCQGPHLDQLHSHWCPTLQVKSHHHNTHTIYKTNVHTRPFFLYLF